MGYSNFSFAIEAPIIVLVESKNADISVALGQVVAEMVAAQIFNQLFQNKKNWRDAMPIFVVYQMKFSVFSTRDYRIQTSKVSCSIIVGDLGGF